jgi:hypothetical protein
MDMVSVTTAVEITECRDRDERIAKLRKPRPAPTPIAIRPQSTAPVHTLVGCPSRNREGGPCLCINRKA